MDTTQRDPEETTAVLERWLRTVADREDARVHDLSIPASTGFSNETILFNATWRERGASRRQELVARIAPSGHLVFPDDTFVWQHAVMSALAERTPVPVPDIHWLEPDTSWFGQPFWIMDRVRGDIATDNPPYATAGWLHDAASEPQARAWWSGIDAMVQIHRVDLPDLCLRAEFLPQPREALAWHLDHWARYMRWAEHGTPFPLGRRALEVLRRNRPPEPAEGNAMLWGDARFSNLIYRDFSVVAVLDWELAGVGDPLMDLAWWLFCDDALTRGIGAERLPGFPEGEETARYWSTATGRSASDLGYHDLFAAYRLSLILLRIGKLLAGLGLVPEGFDQDNHISGALEARLDHW
jgi:aminoglycoside phosphotransferase (APT) family kinase protein